MTQAQLATRQERAAEGVLIASRAEDGFRVYSIDNPKARYSVGHDGERFICTCPDFEIHKSDPDWRCKHILAVEPYQARPLPEMPEPEDEEPQHAEPDGNPPNNARKRKPAKEVALPITMLIKRSVSPDGRIDSVSVEFSMPVVDLKVSEIKDRALTTLQLQREIVTSFLQLNGHVNAQLQPTAKPTPAVVVRKADESPVAAMMLDIGKVNGKWGDRLCITFDIGGQRTRLFGSPKQLAGHIEEAGYTVTPQSLTPGLRLDVPCLVTTKPSDDGKYVNIDQVFAMSQKPVNGGANGKHIN